METYGGINVMNMDMVVEDSGDFQTSTLCVFNKTVSLTCQLCVTFIVVLDNTDRHYYGERLGSIAFRML